MKNIKDILNAAAAKAAALAKKERGELDKLTDRTLEELGKKKTPKEIVTETAAIIGVTLVTGGGAIAPVITGAAMEAVIGTVARKVIEIKKKRRENKPKEGPKGGPAQ